MKAMRNAADAALILRRRYRLEWREQVNLEAAIQNAILDGLTLANAFKFAEDILSNVEIVGSY